jgi:hypothetical protein
LKLGFETIKKGCGAGQGLRREVGEDGGPLADELRLAAGHHAGQRFPAFGPQVVAGGLQPVLQILQLGRLDR